MNWSAALVGLVFGPTGWFQAHLERTPGLELLNRPTLEAGIDWLSMGVGTFVALAGLGAAYLLYGSPSRVPAQLAGRLSAVPAQLATRLRPLYQASSQKFWVDEVYSTTVIAGTWFLAWLSAAFDNVIVDGLVYTIAWIPKLVGRYVLAPLQNGLVQFYAGAMALGVTLLMLYLLLS